MKICLWFQFARVFYRIISVHALKCVPKEMHSSMHGVAMPSVTLWMAC